LFEAVRFNRNAISSRLEVSDRVGSVVGWLHCGLAGRNVRDGHSRSGNQSTRSIANFTGQFGFGGLTVSSSRITNNEEKTNGKV
jgi:hypothetical protein